MSNEHPEALRLATAINNIATSLQYDPSGMWGVETVGPINAAAAELRRLAAVEGDLDRERESRKQAQIALEKAINQRNRAGIEARRAAQDAITEWRNLARGYQANLLDIRNVFDERLLACGLDITAPDEPLALALDRQVKWEVMLTTEVSEIQRDADRYRWLISNCVLGIKQNGIRWYLSTDKTVAPDSLAYMGDTIDTAIQLP